MNPLKLRKTKENEAAGANESNRAVLNMVLTLVNKEKRGNLTVFDDGCNGPRAELTPLLLDANLEVVGMDILQDWLREKQAKFEGRPNLKLVCGDAHVLPFKDKTFDIVIFIEVLEHLPRPDLAVAEIHRCLGHGGRLILSTPNSHGLHSFVYDWLLLHLGSLGKRIRSLEKPTSRHVSVFTFKRLARLLTQQHFEIEQVISPYGLGVVSLSQAALTKCHLPILGYGNRPNSSRLYAIFRTIEVGLSRLLPLSLHSSWVIVARKCGGPDE